MTTTGHLLCTRSHVQSRHCMERLISPMCQSGWAGVCCRKKQPPSLSGVKPPGIVVMFTAGETRDSAPELPDSGMLAGRTLLSEITAPMPGGGNVAGLTPAS